MIDVRRRFAKAGASLLLVAMAMTGCSSHDEPLRFKLQRNKTDLPALVPVANFDAIVETSARDFRLVNAAGAAAKQIGEQLNSGTLTKAGPIRALHLTVSAPGEAQGTTTHGKVMHLSFEARILQQTVRFGGDADTILASANEAGWWTPTNDDVVDDYCGRNANSEFCRKFVTR